MISPDLSYQPVQTDQRPPAGQYEEFDWTGRLSLDNVRQHTKTDDTPGVPDTMLSLYRQAAIEAAEHYTGLLLTGKKTMNDIVHPPNNYREFYRHRLRYPIAQDGFAYLYGRSINMQIPVIAGQRSIKLPRLAHIPDFTNCCIPNSSNMMLLYWAGYDCANAVPAGIVLGCLQFIAWIVEHPGDELLTQRNRMDSSGTSGGVLGSNNIAMISGALETWRQYDAEAI